jgi:hypothetical protein
MAMKKSRFFPAILFLFFLPAMVYGQDHRCSMCHGKKDFAARDSSGKNRPLYVDEELLRNSTHGRLSCIDCHLDAMELPHSKRLKRVNCAGCHDKGRTFEQGPTMEYIVYRDSVHGRELQKGNPKAPNCASCHGSHDILSHLDIRSRGYRLNIPDKMCGRCHEKALSEYRTSVHGTFTTKGDTNPPICTDCHTEHGIRRTVDPTSTVYATNIVAMCVKCHGNFAVMNKYGKKTEEVETYYESFHGVATKYGEKNIAHCVSCHGYHAIMAQADPRSSINPANLPATCGQVKCHPGATANFGKGKVHVNPKSKDSGIIYYVSFGFKWLTITVLLVLFVHIFLDLLRKLQEKKKKRI